VLDVPHDLAAHFAPVYDARAGVAAGRFASASQDAVQVRDDDGE
jgi:hypothetical protein